MVFGKDTEQQYSPHDNGRTAALGASPPPDWTNSTKSRDDISTSHASHTSPIDIPRPQRRPISLFQHNASVSPRTQSPSLTSPHTMLPSPIIPAAGASPSPRTHHPHLPERDFGFEDAGFSSIAPVAPAPSTPFAPLYTLVTDLSTGTTHHPHVHYIFSDDDPELLTSGILSSLREDSTERTVVLDLSADLKTVSEVKSFTPDWAVLDAEVSEAPSVQGGGQGRMVMVRGVGVGEETGVEREGGAQGVEGMIRSVEDLARRFEAEMDVLRTLKGVEGVDREGEDGRMDNTGTGEDMNDRAS